jgi:hypothetical protein
MNASATNSLSPIPATTWKQRYEALRQLAVAGRQILEAEPLGLVLLLRQGVAGWMRSWTEWTQPPSLLQKPVSPVPVLPTSVWQQQLTAVLAEMSFAHLPNTSL